ncbi:MAG TPA: PEP-CTERM sorting domain-containing protein [Rubrivivax sp.]|nr:PEP-CTERM sorting domain-containing protein [Rubrivivax sp.]
MWRRAFARPHPAPSAADGEASAQTSRPVATLDPSLPFHPHERHAMKGLQRSILAGALGLVTAIQVQAGEVSLFDFAFNIDGVVTSQASPAGVSIAGFDTGTGLGTITVSLGGVGPHYVGLFVDHEIDETTNTFFNEHGATSGGALAGQSWEIDEPGFVFGDIWTNFKTGALDGTNGVPSTGPDDVSMAQAWSFALAQGETAALRFWISDVLPANASFYLTQTDPDSQASLYFWSSLRIDSGGNAPEPSSLALVGLGLLGAALMCRRPSRT